MSVVNSQAQPLPAPSQGTPGASTTQSQGQGQQQQHAGKLSTINAQRVIALVQAAAEKLAVLGGLASDTLGDNEKIAKLVSDEIDRITGRQEDLETRYEALIEQQSQANAASILSGQTKAKGKEVQSAIDSLAAELRFATK